MFSLPLALTVIAVGGNPEPASQPAAPEVRRAVERAFPFLEKEGVGWIKQRKCTSCHVVSFMLWSHNEARARGIAVDDKKLQEWNEWSLNFTLSLRAWFKLGDPSWKGLQADGVADDVLAKLKPLAN